MDKDDCFEKYNRYQENIIPFFFVECSVFMYQMYKPAHTKGFKEMYSEENIFRR